MTPNIMQNCLLSVDKIHATGWADIAASHWLKHYKNNNVLIVPEAQCLHFEENQPTEVV